MLGEKNMVLKIIDMKKRKKKIQALNYAYAVKVYLAIAESSLLSSFAFISFARAKTT